MDAQDLGGMTNSRNERLYRMPFASLYPLYVQKLERKGRSRAELDQVILWLTGYDQEGLQRQIDSGASLQRFFEEAPAMNEKASEIKGVVCGVRVELIEEPLMQQIRWLDKLVDELARGKAMDKVLRA